MRKNYTFKTITKGLAILAITLSATLATAQTEVIDVEITAGTVTNPDSDGVGGFYTYQSYGDGETVTMTEQVTVPGYAATFDVSFDVTPASGQKLTFDNTSWGVNNDLDGTALTGNTYRGTQKGQGTINNIQFSNFSGSGISSGNISSYTFTDASIGQCTAKFDRFAYVVSGTEYISTVRWGDDPTIVDLLTYGDGTTSISLTSLTEFTIQARTSASSETDRWGVNSSTVQVTVDTSSLGVNDVFKDDKSLVIFPTVVESTFTVNKEFKTLKIIDISGRTVKSFSTSDVLEVSGLGAGVYIVKLEAEDGGLATKRLIVK